MRCRLSVPVLTLLGACLLARTVRADEDDLALRGTRIGVVPALGFGFTGFTGQRPYFSSFVPTSVTQGDIFFDTGRWGGFLRGGFLSSGSSGRWHAPVLALGPTYRFEGDGEEHWGLVGRAGVVYQRWTANTSGCPVYFFVPESCQDYTPPSSGIPTPQYATTVDHVGLLAGGLLEIPVEPVYLAFGAELSATVDVDHATPGMALAGQLTFAFGFRDHPRPDVDSHPQPRIRRRY